MEFGDLGGICNLCKKQDFLPIKCNTCNKIFCKDHSSFDNHNCSKKKIHVKRTTSSIYKEICNYPNCKKKEIIKFECKDCKLNYCINHRLSFNHNCDTKKINISIKKNKDNNIMKKERCCFIM
jgi:predicted nucleic acid binding AN1-type Zn finger protein